MKKESFNLHFTVKWQVENYLNTLNNQIKNLYWHYANQACHMTPDQHFSFLF